ncbi:UNVERIFIED_CONTAM: hypothetical protein K2H54_056798 [Gekko kuhli]
MALAQAQPPMGDGKIYTLGQDQCCVGSRSTFNWLVDALRDVLHRQRTEMRVPVSVERRVPVAVWWMANTMSYRTVGHQFGLAQSTVAGIVVEVTRAITERLLDRVVYLRNPDRFYSLIPPVDLALMYSGCHHYITMPYSHRAQYPRGDPVVVVSSPEALPGEGQQPDPAAGAIQAVKERMRTMATEMVKIRRTLAGTFTKSVAQ